MKDNFDNGEYDLTSIHETLATYYPINNSFDGKDINNFPGLIKIGELINENFIIRKNYRERWVKFKKFLKDELKKPVRETMNVFFPCYSGIVILQKETSDHSQKELHFFISLLGPYYCILGITQTENKPSITVSPYQDFEDPFQLLQKKIAEYLPELRFIPFDIAMKKVPGISLLYPGANQHLKDTIFSGLFNPDFVIEGEIKGDVYYDVGDWEKK